jgi:uncharacterized protein YutE (UPF0331/DUF86 family)
VTVDRELVTRKLVLILRDLDMLATLSSRSLTDFLGSSFDQAVAERLLERIIGRMVDVNYHLLTQAGEPPPPDYHASFERLAPLGVLDAVFAPRIARCAGLRNRLVHEYEEIDPRKVFEVLASATEDIGVYVRSVQAYLERVAPMDG